MRKSFLIALAALLPVAATAQQPPATVLMPSGVILQVRQYLGRQPHDDVAGLIADMEGCVRVQIPVNGATVSHGECRAVTDALEAQAAKAAKPAPAANPEPAPAK